MFKKGGSAWSEESALEGEGGDGRLKHTLCSIEDLDLGKKMHLEETKYKIF